MGVKDQTFVGGDTPSIADFKVAPFFYAAIQPVVKEKVGFEAPGRAVKYCDDFIEAVGATKLMMEAGGFSIKEYALSKSDKKEQRNDPVPGSRPRQPPMLQPSTMKSRDAKLKVHGLAMSQNVCGSVLLAMDLGVGELELCDLMQGMHKTPGYMKINPYGQVPGLKDGDFVLGESNAIMRYLALAYGQKYYPAASSPRLCAKIDFALDAFSNVYKAHIPIVYTVFGFGEAPSNQQEANVAYCDAITKWFDIHAKDQKFVGGETPSIADFKVAPFFYAAIQPVMTTKLGFKAPQRAIKFCDDFFAAVVASKFMQEAGGVSIKEYAASKDVASSTAAATHENDTYTITIKKEPGKKLGIDVDLADGNTLVIECVAPDGLIAEWNTRSSKDQVKENHKVIEVNGVKGSAQSLADECGSAKDTLVMKIQRG